MKRPDWPKDVVFGLRHPDCPLEPKIVSREDLMDTARKFDVRFLYTFRSENPIVDRDWRSWECLAFTLRHLYCLMFDKYHRTEGMCVTMKLVPELVSIEDVPDSFLPNLYHMHTAMQMLEKKYGELK